MKKSDAESPDGADVMDGAASLWRVPDPQEIQARAKRLQDFAVEVNEIVGETVSGYAQAASAANERIAGAFQGLLSARQPPEIVAAQSDLVQGLMEGVAAHAKVWTEQTQKLGACCAGLARETAAPTRPGARAAAAHRGPKTSSRRSPDKDAGEAGN